MIDFTKRKITSKGISIKAFYMGCYVTIPFFKFFGLSHVYIIILFHCSFEWIAVNKLTKIERTKIYYLTLEIRRSKRTEKQKQFINQTHVELLQFKYKLSIT